MTHWPLGRRHIRRPRSAVASAVLQRFHRRVKDGEAVNRYDRLPDECRSDDFGRLICVSEPTPRVGMGRIRRFDSSTGRPVRGSCTSFGHSQVDVASLAFRWDEGLPEHVDERRV